MDIEDRALVENRSLGIDTGGYAGFTVKDKRLYVHRIVMVLVTGDPEEVDHVNGNRLDNRKKNLRKVNRFEQMQNKKPWGKSGHRNVYWEESKKMWRVSVKKEFVLHTAGFYKELSEAIESARLLRESLFTHHVEDRCGTPSTGEELAPG